MSHAVDKREVQGLVASGFGRQKAADFLLLTIDDPAAAKGWLASLLPRLTTSDDRSGAVKRCVAFSASGLLALGVPKEALISFSKEFREGMVTPHRQRTLGDLPSTPSDPARWMWGGPNTSPVHAVLMIYATDRPACNQVVAEERQTLRGVTVHLGLSSVSLGGKEHFGFADGLTNPFVEGLHDNGLPEDALPAGELVLGYANLTGSVPSSPAVPRENSPHLPVCPTDPRQSDFGKNSTYLVFRQIEQDVRGFWDGIARAAEGAGLDRSHLLDVAAKVIGRRVDGTPLSTVAGTATSRAQTSLAFADDPQGLRCPVGAHIRRANPRDGLLLDPEQSRQSVRGHRLLRRGRAYGKPAPADWYPSGVKVEADDELPEAARADEGRGLHFLCVCADIERQFEFVQQTWMNNQKFGGLFNSTDPMASEANPEGHFTIPGTPVRTRLSGFTPATRTAGGAYLILPSRSALAYLAGVPPG